MAEVSLDKVRSLLEKIQLILLRDWDPIGISDIKNAEDEYFSYGDVVINLVIDGKSCEEICDYLVRSAISMGIDYDSLPDKTRSASEKIVEEARKTGFYR